MTSKKIKALIFAESANPTFVSVPLVGWSLYYALSKKIDAQLITHIRNRESIKSTDIDLSKCTFIDNEWIAKPIYQISNILSGGVNKGWTIKTALNVLPYYNFEHISWKMFKNLIEEKRFDIVHRITPLSPTYPSLIAKKCHKLNTKFVIGPLNGGLPWPSTHRNIMMAENDWLSHFRHIYKLLPGYSNTLKYSSAILVGSKYTQESLPPEVQKKSFYVPENGIDISRFTLQLKGIAKPLSFVFVGRLVPYKGALTALMALTKKLQKHEARITIIGDGPQLYELEEYCLKNNIRSQVNFTGFIPHTEIQHELIKHNFLIFPSIREFGGAVVLEAMAIGLIPIIVDYGGPGELCTSETGFKVKMGSPTDILHDLHHIIDDIFSKTDQEILKKSRLCIEHVSKYYTWDCKADQIVNIYTKLLDS